MPEGLFDGLRVIDCGSYIAAPASATVLSDFGAAVIKIEPPGAGDPYRTRAQLPPGHAHPVSPFWLLDNRDKRSLALDLGGEAGQAVLRRLVTTERTQSPGALVPFENDELLTVTSRFWVEGQEKATPRHSPRVGEHSDAVLREAGYADSEIEATRAARVIG